jgi:hypothetical protein
MCIPSEQWYIDVHVIDRVAHRNHPSQRVSPSWCSKVVEEDSEAARPAETVRTCRERTEVYAPLGAEEALTVGARDCLIEYVRCMVATLKSCKCEGESVVVVESKRRP